MSFNIFRILSKVCTFLRVLAETLGPNRKLWTVELTQILTEGDMRHNVGTLLVGWPCLQLSGLFGIDIPSEVSDHEAKQLTLRHKETTLAQSILDIVLTCTGKQLDQTVDTVIDAIVRHVSVIKEDLG